MITVTAINQGTSKPIEVPYFKHLTPVAANVALILAYGEETHGTIYGEIYGRAPNRIVGTVLDHSTGIGYRIYKETHAKLYRHEDGKYRREKP